MKLKNNAPRAQWILIVFYIMLAFSPVILVSHYMQYTLVSGNINVEEAEANDLRQQIIIVINLLIHLLAIVFFIMWFSRAYENLHETDAKLEFTKDWAVWAWFIPFLNLVRPYQIMKEIWVKTQEQSGQMIKESETFLIGLWWGALIISNAITRASGKMYEKAETLKEIADGTIVTIVAELLSLPGLILIIVIIRKVSVFEADLYNQKNNVDLVDHLVKED